MYSLNKKWQQQEQQPFLQYYILRERKCVWKQVNEWTTEWVRDYQFWRCCANALCTTFVENNFHLTFFTGSFLCSPHPWHTPSVCLHQSTFDGANITYLIRFNINKLKHNKLGISKIYAHKFDTHGFVCCATLQSVCICVSFLYTLLK